MRSLILAALLLFAAAFPSVGQIHKSLFIHESELAARLRFLSSDLFQGRYPGTAGESLTTSYIISELQSFGVRPAAGGSWTQPVSIVVHKPDTEHHPIARTSGLVEGELQLWRDIWLSNFTTRAQVKASGELVFVGFGISAPMYGWDDFKTVDLRGKVAIALLGEPTVAEDSTLFNGFRASRYSWSRDKTQEIERRGAIGVLWLRPFGSISKSPLGGSSRLAEEADRSTLLFSGTITDSTLARLLPQASASLRSIMSETHSRRFRPIPLATSIQVEFQTQPSIFRTNNVIGVVAGTDSSLSSEYVVASAHWDAFGITTPVNGDSIHNGALDDGSGLTALLALSRVFASNPQPRSISFLFATGEELMLLGAEAFLRNGPISPFNIVANINLDDGGELFGLKRDVAPLGIELSTLGATVANVAERHGLSVSEDPFPQEGFFLRADNFPFAKKGIPSLYMALGTSDSLHPQGWTKSKLEEYLTKHYHMRSDEYDTVALDLRGAVQFAEFTRDVIIEVARQPARPQWYPGSEYRRDQSPTAPAMR